MRAVALIIALEIACLLNLAAGAWYHPKPQIVRVAK